MTKESHVPCLDSPSLFSYSNASLPVSLSDNSSYLQDSFLHFPFLPPDYSSLLPCVDIHNAGFFHEFESLGNSNTVSSVQSTGCDGSSEDCSNLNNIGDHSCTVVNASTGSNKTNHDPPNPLSFKPFIERRVRNKGRVPRRNCPRLVSPFTKKKFPAESSGWSKRRAASCPRKRKLVLEYPNPYDSLRLLFRKELRNSDVSSLGRVIIPKREAETNLPTLACKEGLRIRIKDMASAQAWTMRYRFWPNNKSRMYVLQNARDFIRMYRLKTGDAMSLYRDDETGQYFILASKAGDSISSFHNGDVVSTEDDKEGSQMDLSGSSNGEYRPNHGDDITIRSEDSSKINKDNGNCNINKECIARCCSSNSEISCITDLCEYQLSSLENFGSINDCDLSFCDDEMTMVI